MSEVFKSNKKTEAEGWEQAQLFLWAEWQKCKYPELELMYHIPNEGKRSQALGAKMRREGLKAGVPDICLPVPRADKHGLYIELKTTGNRVTEKQAQWLKKLDSQGYATAICYGWETASQVILKYLKGEKI